MDVLNVAGDDNGTRMSNLRISKCKTGKGSTLWSSKMFLRR